MSEQLSIVDCRPEVLAFAIRMEEKLRTKDAEYPRSWREDTLEGLFAHLDEEVIELDTAIGAVSNGDMQKVIGEAVDVANMAMMIADTAESLKTK